MRFPNILRAGLTSIVACFLLANCTSTSTTDQSADTQESSQPDSTSQQVARSSAAEDPLKFEDIELEEGLVPWSDSLRKYFNPSQVDMLNRAVAQYKSIKSAAELADFYQVTLRDSIQP